MTCFGSDNWIFIVLENILCDVLWDWNLSNAARCWKVYAKYTLLPQLIRKTKFHICYVFKLIISRLVKK